MKRLCLVVGFLVLGVSPLGAQQAGTLGDTGVVVTAPEPDPQTLADIQTELDRLKSEMEGLRSELLLNDPATSGVVNPAPVLDRVDTMNEELRRLTAQVEELGNRVERIVADGTNRIGDLEFRLLELEGGDFSTLGETPPLGQGDTRLRPQPVTQGTPPGSSPQTPVEQNLGSVRPVLRARAVPASVITPPASTPPGTPVTTPPVTPPPAAVTATSEEAFQQALSSFRTGSYFDADRQFLQYLTTYPNSPRAGEAAFWRGESLAAQNDWQPAARSFLDSFSGSPDGPFASDALFRLGVSLGRIGQTDQACRTLTEVPIRFPSLTNDLAAKVQTERAALGCR